MLKKSLSLIPLTGVCIFAVAAIGGEIVYHYDSLNRLTNSVYSQGVVATYKYDSAHNVREVKLIKDTDNDGLPDYWEMLYFGSLTATDGTSDFDGDGLSDYAEYLAGTFRQAETQIPYRMATEEEAASEAWKFTTRNNGTSVRIRGE